MANGRYRHQRLMGPIVLITLGILFLLDQFHIYDFSETWPILLIAIGAVKILERFVATKETGAATWQAPSTPRSPGGAEDAQSASKPSSNAS